MLFVYVNLHHYVQAKSATPEPLLNSLASSNFMVQATKFESPKKKVLEKGAKIIISNLGASKSKDADLCCKTIQCLI